MNKGNTLIGYGVALLLLGVAAVMYNPKTNEVGLYMEGKTGLIVCGAAAIVSIVFGIIAKNGKYWPHIAGAILAFTFLGYAFWKAFQISRDISPDAQHAYLWYKAMLFWLISMASLCAMVPLLIFIRQEKVN